MLEIIRAEQGVLAYFSTRQCTVCKVLRPKVEALVSQYPGMRFLYIDTEEYPALGGQHLVFAAPTLILFNEGREVKRFSRNVSLGDLDRFLSLLARENDV